MLNLFNNKKGSITVLSSLLLIPIVFFIGFFTEIVRIKSYTNMAIMAADSYGEAYLAQYDNILKDAYGLFAITQEPEGLEEAKFYKDAIKWDFDPSGEKVTGVNRFIAILKEAITGEGQYPEGTLMPMKSVKAELECEPIDHANLTNTDVLGTQIDDFMKYRIVQVLMEDKDGLIDTLNSVKALEGDTKIVNKKLAYDDAAQQLVDAVREFYNEAKNLDEDYRVRADNLSIQFAQERANLKNAIDAELKREEAELERLKEERKQQLAENSESEEQDNSAELEEIENMTLPEDVKLRMRQEASDSLMEPVNTYNDDIYDYYEKTEKDFIAYQTTMDNKLAAVRNAFNVFEAAEKNLKRTLDAERGNASSSALVSGIDRDIEKYKDLLQDESGRIECYVHLVDYIKEHYSLVYHFFIEAGKDEGNMGECVRYFIEGQDPDYSKVDKQILNVEEWKRYYEAPGDVHQLYEGMKKTFDNAGDTSKAEKQRNKANKMRKKAEKVLEEDEDLSQITKRNINPSFNFGDDDGQGDITGDDKIKQLVQRTSGYFGHSNDTLEQIMTKFFVTAYDFGMFTCRTTNVDGNIEESITQIPKTADVNYLYRAELEYILCGNNNTKKNLDSARNRILGFKSVFNYIASYSISEVNAPIQEAGAAASAVATPLIGIALEQSLRFAFAGIETAADWHLLKKGDKVLVVKTKIDDLSAVESFNDLMNDASSGDGDIKGRESAASDGFKLNYKQYLQVMMLFFIKNTNVLKRTSNVITLNMNNIKYPPGGADAELSELKYKLRDAHTAVESYCTVSSKFVVMPKGFAKQVVPGEYSEIESLERNQYKFKVTRSY